MKGIAAVQLLQNEKCKMRNAKWAADESTDGHAHAAGIMHFEWTSFHFAIV
jgi:hypothetical protein